MLRIDLTQEVVTQLPSEGNPSLSNPGGLVFINMWDLFYVADSGNHIIRKITDTNLTDSQVGSGTAGYVDASGAAAQLNNPLGMSLRLSDHMVFFADNHNHRVRQFVAGA